MDEQLLLKEITYKAVRSSGAGGQNVNKVSSKVELHFSLEASEGLSEEEKNRLRHKLESRLTKNQELILQSEESRSQHKNRELVSQRFLELIRTSLIKPKIRKKTKPSRAAREKRLQEKKQVSEKKSTRRQRFD